MRRIAKLTKLKITYGVDLDDKRIPDQKMGNNKTGGFYQIHLMYEISVIVTHKEFKTLLLPGKTRFKCNKALFKNQAFKRLN